MLLLQHMMESGHDMRLLQHMMESRYDMQLIQNTLESPPHNALSRGGNNMVWLGVD